MYTANDIELVDGVVRVRGTELNSFSHVHYKILELLIEKSPFHATFGHIREMWKFSPIKDESFTDVRLEDPGPTTFKTIERNVQRLRASLDQQLGIKGSIKPVRSIGYKMNTFL